MKPIRFIACEIIRPSRAAAQTFRTIAPAAIIVFCLFQSLH